MTVERKGLPRPADPWEGAPLTTGWFVAPVPGEPAPAPLAAPGPDPAAGAARSARLRRWAPLAAAGVAVALLAAVVVAAARRDAGSPAGAAPPAAAAAAGAGGAAGSAAAGPPPSPSATAGSAPPAAARAERPAAQPATPAPTPATSSVAPSPTPDPVHRTDSARLNTTAAGGEAADLDAGRVGDSAGSRPWDVGAVRAGLRTFNGVRLVPWSGPATPQACAAAPGQPVASVPAAEVVVGAGYCLRTNAGRAAYLRVRKVVGAGGGDLDAVVLDYTVWGR